MEIDDKAQKMLVLAGVLPVLADMIEDLNDNLFKQTLKFKAKALYDEIRKNDEMILKNTGVELATEQVNIQRAFHLWVKSGFNVHEAQKLVKKTIKE
jgi:hypothetical protein